MTITSFGADAPDRRYLAGAPDLKTQPGRPEAHPGRPAASAGVASRTPAVTIQETAAKLMVV